MIHDRELLDRLADLPTVSFGGEVFRATRLTLKPLASSASGGRWGPQGGPNVLYTSLQREGALAEIAFHWSQQTPRPSRPAVVHTLRVKSPATLRLLRTDISALGVNEADYERVNLKRTQEIGAAVEFLGFDGIIAPCARWACDNLILFPESASFGGDLEAIAREEVDWLEWGRAQGLLDD